MFPFSRTTTSPTSSGLIADRIAASQKSIADEKEVIPRLREEDASLEAEISRLIGRQIAEGADVGAEIADLRRRRAQLASQIEGMTAEAAYAKQGIAEAERLETEAKIREKRKAGNAVRARMAPLLRRSAELLQELWFLDTQIADAITQEREMHRAEVALDRTGPHSATPPSGYERTGVLWPIVESFRRSDPPAERERRFVDAIEAIRTAAARAEELSKEQV